VPSGLVCALLSGVMGCGAPAAPTVIDVRLSSALGCRPTRIDSARVEVWGDFLLRDEHVMVQSGSAPIARDGWPAETEALFVSLSGGGFVGRGVVAAPLEALQASVLILPSDRACPLPDPEVRLLPGMGVASLPGGALLFVGGLDSGGSALRRVLLLGAGDELGDMNLAAVFIPVAYASVTAVAAREVLVAGGAAEEGGAPLDTFERLDLDDPPGAPRRVGTLARGRREHAALSLADGGVVLVGGADRTGLLDSIERIDPDGTSGRLLGARLRTPRSGATLVERSDGSVFIAGGTDAGGASSALEVLAPTGISTEALALGQPPARTVVALPGPRLLWIGTDGSVSVVLLEGSVTRIDIGLTLPDGVVVSSSLGELLVHDEATEELVLVARDLSSRRVPSSRRGEALVVTDDGTFVELDAAGGSRFRPSVASPFSPPPSSFQFPLDAPSVVLDAPTRWREGMLEGGLGALIAEQEGASLDVPVLRMRAFSVELRTLGAGTLWLTAAPGLGAFATRVRAITFTDHDASIDGCHIERAAGAPLIVTRVGDALTLAAGVGSSACEVSLPDRVGVGLSLAAGAAVSSIRIARQ